MKIVIDIDDEQTLLDIKNQGLEGESETDKVIINALYNGTILPKHGRLIDADALEVSMADDWHTANEIANCIKYAPTIIEADKESD